MHFPHPAIAMVVLVVHLLLFVALTPLPQTHSGPATTPTLNVAGRYRVVGTNPDGSEYTGNLQVIPRGNVFQFRWNAGTQYDGICERNVRIVAVAFANGNDGSGCGVVDYNVLKDGTLDGIWGYWGTDASGTEKARRVNGSGLEGEYAATGTNPDGKRYQVNVSVQAAGRGYKFSWRNNSEGFGIRRGDNIAVGIGGERCGFVAYEVKADGSLDGVWGSNGSQQTGTERATKQ